MQGVANQYLASSQLHGNVVIGAETDTDKFRERGFRIDNFGQ